MCSLSRIDNSEIPKEPKDHCKSAYTNDIKWAKAYLEQDKSIS
jgi:hypothetical protein